MLLRIEKQRIIFIKTSNKLEYSNLNNLSIRVNK